MFQFENGISNCDNQDCKDGSARPGLLEKCKFERFLQYKKLWFLKGHTDRGEGAGVGV